MKKVAVVAIVVGLLAVGWYLQSRGTFDGPGSNTTPGGNTGGPVIMDGDDDRPPVVVSGGSVIIEQQIDAKDEVRGEFEMLVTGDLKGWRSKHEKPGNNGGKKPKSLTVVIDNGTTNLPGCKPTFVHTKVMSLTFSYVTQDGTSKDFTVKIDEVDEALQIHLPENATQQTNSKFRLTIPNVTLTTVKVGANDPCALHPTFGRVEMRQRK